MLIQKSLSLWLLTWNMKKLFQLLIIKVYPLVFGVNRGRFFCNSAMECYWTNTLPIQLEGSFVLTREAVIFELMSTVKWKYFLNIRWTKKTVPITRG